VLLLTVFSTLLYVVIGRALVNQFDASLVSIAQVLAGAVERDGDQIEMDVAAQQMPELRNAGLPTYHELWRADGTVVTKSPLLGERDLPRPEGSGRTLACRTLHDAPGKPLRATGLAFVPKSADREGEADAQSPNQEALTLAVARDVSDLLGQLRSLRWLLLTASAAVIAMSLLIAVTVVGQGLRPLNAVAAEIAGVNVDDLTMRINADGVPTEAIPIKDRLNELLSRLEASFKRERQFNADVAHEMRTPLAGLRSTIEVSLARTRDPTEYRAALAECLEIAQGMQSVVGNLLMLARLDTRQIAFKTEEIRPTELVDACWRTLADRAYERQVAFENSIPAELTCRSDREHLSMVFSNLLDNAVEYADEGGRIWTTARRSADSVGLAISNTGCRLTGEQVAHVFDAFWRGDSSRAATGTHCGLGLPLVQRLVEALGGRVTAGLQPDGIFTVQLTFPIRV
jgi:signal transduction histidine kinase